MVYDTYDRKRACLHKSNHCKRKELRKIPHYKGNKLKKLDCKLFFGKIISYLSRNSALALECF